MHNFACSFQAYESEQKKTHSIRGLIFIGMVPNNYSKLSEIKINIFDKKIVMFFRLQKENK